MMGATPVSSGETDIMEGRPLARRTIDDLLEGARARLERSTPEAAAAAMKNGAILIDIRCQELRQEAGIVPDSLHVPLSVLYWRVGRTGDDIDPRLSDPTRQLLLLCAHGYSSSLAAATLRDLGFDGATDVIGGFEGWQAAGLPVEPVA